MKIVGICYGKLHALGWLSYLKKNQIINLATYIEIRDKFSKTVAQVRYKYVFLICRSLEVVSLGLM